MRVHNRGTPKRPLWWFDFGFNGRRYRGRCERCATKKEAELYASRKLLEVSRGGDPGLLTLTEAVWLWTRERVPSPSGKQDLRRVQAFLDATGGKTRLQSVARPTISRWVESIAQTRSAQTALRYKSSLGSFYRWCLARGLVESSPVIGASAPKSAKRKKPALTPKQIRTALDATDGALHAAYRLAFFQGLRRSEIARARFEDADHERARFRVRGTKTARAEQVLPLHATLSAWLLAQGKTEGPIVAREDGGHYHPASIENLRQNAGGDLPNFHLGRHSLATIIITEGGTLDDVAALLRISPRTAHEHYAWLVPESRGSVLNRFQV